MRSARRQGISVSSEGDQHAWECRRPPPGLLMPLVGKRIAPATLTRHAGSANTKTQQHATNQHVEEQCREHLSHRTCADEAITSAGAVAANQIASWNGGAWLPLVQG